MCLFEVTKYLLLLNLVIALCISCSSNKNEDRKPVHHFDLNDVTLLDGPFKKATELNRKVLLTYEPDRFLSKFRIESGLKPKANHYSGWESESLAGHSLGHYLSACALMYRTTNDLQFLDRVKYIVDELEECQLVDGDGYIGAFPNGKKIFEDEIVKGIIKSQSFYLNGIWAPYYTQHKVMAGLRDAYHLCGVEKALEVETKFADWLYSIVASLDDEQVQKMLECEHGGINEVLADLYADTKNTKYLNLSKKFHHKAILDSLAEGIDILPGKHGNTQVPKLIGLARRYEINGDINDKKAAEYFWNRVVNHHSYVTGGHGNHEYFGQPDQLRSRLSDETTETCNVYNMLKLSRHLFEWNPRADVADYYERALFNQILSSQHPGDGRVIYNLSLEMGGYKNYEDPFGFTCCVGTGMENHSKYGRNIYFKNDHELYVVQFIASVVKWKEMGVKVTQSTGYPKEQGTTLILECETPKKFMLYIRYPYWVEKGINISINGISERVDQPKESFISLNREWHNGDVVDVTFPFNLRLETMPDDSNRLVVMYGPLVLAGDLGPVDDPDADNPDYVPVIITKEREPDKLFRKVEEEINRFKLIDGVGNPRSFTLLPFYEIYDRRYSVYWDIYSEEGWKEYQLQYEIKMKQQEELEGKTFDFFQPGEIQQETDHNFKGEQTRIVDFKHKKARVADRGGWLSYELKVDPDTAMAVVVNYWGGFTGSKSFDILVDDTKIATENISGKKDGEFINVQYDIPPDLTNNKDYITVKFLPHIGHRAGPFFGARTVRK
ncbi:MAG: glycoside hydrolase family 127 protein [Ignavibacteria bacterium]|jgi:DUF1680 family protein